MRGLLRRGKEGKKEEEGKGKRGAFRRRGLGGSCRCHYLAVGDDIAMPGQNRRERWDGGRFWCKEGERKRKKKEIREAKGRPGAGCQRRPWLSPFYRCQWLPPLAGCNAAEKGREEEKVAEMKEGEEKRGGTPRRSVPRVTVQAGPWRSALDRALVEP